MLQLSEISFNIKMMDDDICMYVEDLNTRQIISEMYCVTVKKDNSTNHYYSYESAIVCISKNQTMESIQETCKTLLITLMCHEGALKLEVEDVEAV